MESQEIHAAAAVHARWLINAEISLKILVSSRDAINRVFTGVNANIQKLQILFTIN